MDDDEAIRLLVEIHLGGVGGEIVGVSTGDEALELMGADSTFDMVVCDWRLPGHLNGVDVINEARRTWPGVRVVLMSAQVPAELTSIAADNDVVVVDKMHIDGVVDIWRDCLALAD